MMKLIVIIFVLGAAIYAANGLCNTCSAITGLACVADRKFKICNNGIPVPPAIECPSGTVCTPNAFVCAPASSTQSSCARCGLCNNDKTFACTGYNTFKLCNSEDLPDPDSIEYTCPGQTTCNVDSPNICVNGNTTGLGATCPWEELTTPTPTTTEAATTTTLSPETQPTEFCASKNFPGRFEIITDDTCRKYINCILNNGNWQGDLYECPSEAYFNPGTQMCGINKPSRCD